MSEVPRLSVHNLALVDKKLTFPEGALRIFQTRQPSLLVERNLEKPLVLYVAEGTFSFVPDIRICSPEEALTPEVYSQRLREDQSLAKSRPRNDYQVWTVVRQFDDALDGADLSTFPHVVPALADPLVSADDFTTGIRNIYEILIKKDRRFFNHMPTALSWVADQKLRLVTRYESTTLAISV